MIFYKCVVDFLLCMVLVKGCYVILWCDGYILIGSILEYLGFDKMLIDEVLESFRVFVVELLLELVDM